MGPMVPGHWIKMFSTNTNNRAVPLNKAGTWSQEKTFLMETMLHVLGSCLLTASKCQLIADKLKVNCALCSRNKPKKDYSYEVGPTQIEL